MKNHLIMIYHDEYSNLSKYDRIILLCQLFVTTPLLTPPPRGIPGRLYLRKSSASTSHVLSLSWNSFRMIFFWVFYRFSMFLYRFSMVFPRFLQVFYRFSDIGHPPTDDHLDGQVAGSKSQAEKTSVIFGDFHLYKTIPIIPFLVNAEKFLWYIYIL